MFWSLKKKKESVLNPDLYELITDDVRIWVAIELTTLAPRTVDGKQINPLLNFVTFDLHTLVTREGFTQMMRLLTGSDTDQTVMLRLKSLVCDLYIKYGTDVIDELRERIYSTLTDMYALNFNVEDQLDVNNTFWLYPIMLRVYNASKLKEA